MEEWICTAEGHANWRCAVVIKDAGNTESIRVACKDEAELQQVKKQTAAAGVRVLRDHLYPVKVDNANRTVVLDQDGEILP
jgi:hypothetical protein